MWFPVMYGSRKRETAILGCVPFIMRNPLPFPFHRVNRCFTALDAGQGGMFLPLSCSTKIIPFRKRSSSLPNGPGSTCRRRNIARKPKKGIPREQDYWKSIRRPLNIFIISSAAKADKPGINICVNGSFPMKRSKNLD